MDKIKVLVVVSGNANCISPFIKDQVDALEKIGVEIKYFLIRGRGFFGYLKNLSRLKERMRNFSPNIIHAHYGLSGLLAILQRKLPVVITFHGSDVNNKNVKYFSRIASRYSAANIFVSQEMLHLMPTPNSYVIPCGVDMAIFKPISQEEAKKEFGLERDKKYILFSSNFENTVKNYPLSKSAVSLLEIDNVELIELQGFTREQVAHLMCAVDVIIMTSFSEGSPQFIKEAMACCRPIVSTNVGDVTWIFGNEPGHFLTNYVPKDVSEKIEAAMDFCDEFGKPNGRNRILELGLDAETIANKISAIYCNVIYG